MSAPYELEINSACDGDTLDQARAFEIYDKVAVEGNEGAQQLAQAVIARFKLYSNVSEKNRLLNLIDILVVNCDSTFHQHLAEEGFFQTLISDRKVQSDHDFRSSVQAHLTAWLESLSEKALGIASDVLGRLSHVKGEIPTDHQPGSSNPRASSDQLLNRGPRGVITFHTPNPEKPLCKFLLSSYVQAGDIVRTSRRVKWFSLQAIHIARQAFHLIIRFNDFVGPDGPTEQQYDEGMELDDALEELEDKIGELEKLQLYEAIESEEDHKYDLARLYQIFFSTRDFYLNGRDYKTDPVFRQLANTDHARLILARCLQARDPHTEGFQIPDTQDVGGDDNTHQGHISDVRVSQAGPDDTETVPAGGSSSSPQPELHPTLSSNMYRVSPFDIPKLRDSLPLRPDGQPDFVQRVIKNVQYPPKPPLDEEFWLHDAFSRRPNVAFIRKHFYKEGRLQEHQALWILEEGRNLMKEEPNVLAVEAPVTIVGNIHGQFYDLMTLMKPAIGGSPSSTRYLFLGGYVDRGCFGIECLLFLLALKICYQGNYLFLRGNHESQHMTNYFTFRLECQKKYSDAVYNASVLAFQAMPLAAIVNQQLFCVHGGLSPELKTIGDLEKIDRFCEPGTSGIMCDILWSDPAKIWKPDGPPYQENPERGCSFIYGYEAVKTFLDGNHLKLMIRSHQAQALGFFRHDIAGVPPHLMTIFSAPNYCDVHGNLGAILKYDGKTMSLRQFNHVEHPFWLPNFQDVFTWSFPFVAEKAVELLNALLDVSTDEDLPDYYPSPQLPFMVEPMDVDVVGVVPESHPREGRKTALQQGSDRPAEVYGLSREQTEDAGADMDSTNSNLY